MLKFGSSKNLLVDAHSVKGGKSVKAQDFCMALKCLLTDC